MLILLPFIATLLQGGYFVYQSCMVVLVFLFLFWKKEILLNKKFIVVFGLICFGLILSDAFSHTTNFYFDIVKYFCLFIPFLVSSKEEKDKLLFGSFLAITILSGIGVFSYLLKLQGTQLFPHRPKMCKFKIL